jgi:hypothetical protein
MKQKTSLNPILSKALNSLDLQLETELQRYRRKKIKEKSFSRVGSNAPAPRISTPLFVDLKSIPQVQSTSSFPSTPIPENLPLIAHSSELRLTQEAPESSSHHEHKLQLPTFSDSPHTPSAHITSHLSLEEISSLIHKSKEQKQQENLATPLEENQPPHEYLESSEQLLASLNEEDQETQISSTQVKENKHPQTKQTFFKYLTTPLGIGSLLLLFVSSALLSSLIFAPESFSYLGLNNWLSGKKSKTDADNLNTNNPPVNNNLPAVSAPSVSNGASLTNEEFAPIELENLSTLESKAKPSVIPLPPTSVAPTPNQKNPANTTSNLPNNPQINPPINNSNIPPNLPNTVTQNNEDLASVLLPPSLMPPVNKPYIEPPTLLPPPNLNGNQNSTTNNNINNKYLVIIPYNGEQSLNQVRQVIKEAFVRDFPDGKRIQLATFKTQNEAQQFVARLAQSGISASIYSLN